MKKYKFSETYVGQSKNFEVSKGAYINKGACGCGLTTFLLTNRENVVVLMPKKSLIQNKMLQITGLFGVDGDTVKEDIECYIEACESKNKPIKICCTFDSCYKIECFLDRCRLVFDECDEFFIKYNSKNRGGQNLYRTTLEIAKKYRDTVTFVTATTIPIKYLPTWMQGLETETYEFENTETRKPFLMKRQKPINALINEIIMPIVKNGEVTIKTKTFSKVLVFCNSIRTIMEKIIPTCGLTKEQVAFYIGDSIDNDKKLDKYKFRRFTGINDLAQFNFVTSSGYSGVDFYDKEAMTVIVSWTDTNKDYTMVDFNTQLKQAASRIRNTDNPNSDRFIFLYNQSFLDEDEQLLVKKLDAYKIKLENFVIGYNDINANGDKCQKIVTEMSEKNKDVQAFTYMNKDNIRVLDEVAFCCTRYLLEQTRATFKKGFEVAGDIYVKENRSKKEWSYKTIVDAVKNGERLNDLQKNTQHYKDIVAYFEKTGNYTYNQTYCHKIANAENKYDILEIDIKNTFEIGNKYTKSMVKDVLKKLYKKNNIYKTAKGSDLCNYFDLSNTSLRDSNGKVVNAFLIKEKITSRN